MINDENRERLVKGVLAGNVRDLSRALRLVDDRVVGYMALLADLYPTTGRAHVVGVTGTPGAGKSTLVDGLVTRARAKGKRVAVLAIDPTSPFSGGAILGDRIRMQRHFLDDDVFIRSVATRGHMGGLSRSATDMVRVFDAAGYDLVFVETVGVGQDELEVTRVADTTVVVFAPGLGDDVQAIKAGIVEIADIMVVNKSDRPGSDATVHDLEQAIRLGMDVRGESEAHGESAELSWSVPVLKTVSTTVEGVDELMLRCDQHLAFVRNASIDDARRLRRVREDLASIVQMAMIDEVSRRMETYIDEAVTANSNPYRIAASLIAELMAPADGTRGAHV